MMFAAYTPPYRSIKVVLCCSLLQVLACARGPSIPQFTKIDEITNSKQLEAFLEFALASSDTRSIEKVREFSNRPPILTEKKNTGRLFFSLYSIKVNGSGPADNYLNDSVYLYGVSSNNARKEFDLGFTLVRRYFDSSICIRFDELIASNKLPWKVAYNSHDALVILITQGSIKKVIGLGRPDKGSCINELKFSVGAV